MFSFDEHKEVKDKNTEFCFVNVIFQEEANKRKYRKGNIFFTLEKINKNCPYVYF